MNALPSAVDALVRRKPRTDVAAGLDHRIEIQLVAVRHAGDALIAQRFDVLELALHRRAVAADRLPQRIELLLGVRGQMLFEQSAPVGAVRALQVIPLVVAVAARLRSGSAHGVADRRPLHVEPPGQDVALVADGAQVYVFRTDLAVFEALDVRGDGLLSLGRLGGEDQAAHLLQVFLPIL